METPPNPDKPPSDPMDTLDRLLKESRNLRERGEQALQANAWDLGISETAEMEKAPLELGPVEPET